MNRRNAFKYLSFIGLAPFANRVSAVNVSGNKQLPDRKYWLDVLLKIADPLLDSLSKGELRKNMPVECKPGKEADRRNVTYLEAFGRLMAGMSPWLELGEDDSAEGQIRKKYIGLAQKSMKKAVDPESSDFMNFNDGGQPLVDAAFLAHAILRAPNVLWKQLDEATQKQIVAAMKSSRVITPGYSNWLLFSAMVEAFLLFAGEQHDELRMDLAIRKHMEWYKGDGMYGDGPDFHWDYYNSYVIQPMLADVLKELVKHGEKYKQTYKTVIIRAKRYAVIQEKLISPEGTFPAIGRSLPYRFGAFQLLAQMSLQQLLPEELNPAQVRSALSVVIQKMIEAPGVFDSNGWLQIGFYGHQPDIAESYISTGSLYLCSVGLLPLGLPASDPFWTGAHQDWTSRKIWSGQNFQADHAIHE
ncbi:MAG: DUF2264 domain-containing protein [Prolixibacteraceae bacterium]